MSSTRPGGGLTSSREVERKFRVHALFRLPDLAELPGVSAALQEDVRLMTAVYHDTADLTLFRWGITLRRREGGPDEGWHIKFPVDDAEGSVRDELHLPLAEGGIGDVPAQIRTLVSALVRGEPLVPVATLRTQRHPTILRDLAGRDAVEVVDDTVSIMEGRHVAVRFREIEAEAMSPEAATGTVMTSVSDALLQAGAQPGTTSKAATAVGPRAAEPPDIPEPDPVDADDPARMAVQAHLLRHTRRLLQQDVRVRRDLPDSVHQMRVAARRLRSGLQAFGPLVDADWAKRLRNDLGWIAGELGSVRDTEVMIERLDERAGDLPQPYEHLARQAVDSVLGAQMADARSHALAAMGSQRYADLLLALVEGVLDPPFTPAADATCADVLPKLVNRAWKRLSKDVDRLHIDSAAEPWHEARIAAKKARYTTEAVEPVFGKSARPLSKALEEVTELLGDHQDAHVAQQTLADMAGSGGVDSRSAFALGLLYALEVDHEMSLRHRFRRLWPRVAKAHGDTELGG